MKAKVLTAFYDTVARVKRDKGDIIEVSPARFCEICSNVRFLEACGDIESAETEQK